MNDDFYEIFSFNANLFQSSLEGAEDDISVLLSDIWLATRWVPLWLHTGHVHIAGRKMSKSLKNFITVRELLNEHHPDDLRIFCLQARDGHRREVIGS